MNSFFVKEAVIDSPRLLDEHQHSKLLYYLQKKHLISKRRKNHCQKKRLHFCNRSSAPSHVPNPKDRAKERGAYFEFGLRLNVSNWV